MFFSKPLVSDDLAHWVFDNFDWAIETYGPSFWQKPDNMVLLTKDYFKAPAGGEHETALGILHDIQTLLNLDHLNIRLEPLPSLPEGVTHEYGKMSDIAGQYWHDEKEPLITYNPKNLKMPVNFISTIAHELMHAKLANHIWDMPGGEEAHELNTDLHCIIHGFGLIQIQGAAAVGWAGYMTQPTRAFATAVFATLTGSQDKVASALPYREAKLMKKAFKDLTDWQEELATLKSKTRKAPIT